MAGQPLKRRMVAELERLAAERSTPEEPITALDYVHDFIASEGKMSDLAYKIGKALGVNGNASILTHWVNSQPNGLAMLRQARILGSHRLMDEALDIVDDADETKEALQKAKLRAEQRNLLASKWNRQDYGADTAQVNVQVNMGQLHLDALRARFIPEEYTPPALPAPAEEGADYETVPTEQLELL